MRASEVEITNPSAEILKWAEQQFTDEEILAGVREIRDHGDLELGDFIHELEQIASDDDRASQ